MGPTEIGRSTQALNEAALDLSHFFRLQAGLNLSFGVAVGIYTLADRLAQSRAMGGARRCIAIYSVYWRRCRGGRPALNCGLGRARLGQIDCNSLRYRCRGIYCRSHHRASLYSASKTRLSPLAVLIAAAFWTTLWGPVGLMLALPLTLGLVVFGEHIPHLAFLRVLLGNNPALTSEQRLYHLLLAGDASEAAEEARSTSTSGRGKITWRKSRYLLWRLPPRTVIAASCVGSS